MQVRHQGKPKAAAVVARWLIDQKWNAFWCVVGLAAGFLLNPILTDRVLPYVYKPSAKITVMTPSPPPLGRQVALDIRTGTALPGHSFYVVVESNKRYWPQASLEPRSKSEIMVNLGATGPGDVGNTFIAHVIDVSGAADTIMSNYFSDVNNPNASVRSSGIDIQKVKNRIKFLASQTMKRGQE